MLKSIEPLSSRQSDQENSLNKANLVSPAVTEGFEQTTEPGAWVLRILILSPFFACIIFAIYKLLEDPTYEDKQIPFLIALVFAIILRLIYYIFKKVISSKRNLKIFGAIFVGIIGVLTLFNVVTALFSAPAWALSMFFIWLIIREKGSK